MPIRYSIPALTLAILMAACSPAASPQTEAPAAIPAPTQAPEAAEPTAEAQAEAPAGGAAIFSLVPAETVAQFVIEEILSGNPTTVIGTTGGVSGSFSLDLADPKQASLSPIEVDLTGLQTDNGFRNRAIQEAILVTGQEGNRLATFVATSIDGLPDQVELGTSYPLKITGDLTVKGTTSQVTFDVTVTPVTEDRIEGTASLTIPYAELGVNIPRLPPQVASVEDDVRLELQFVAAR